MVLLEALAAGLPVVASKMTGAPDLQELITATSAVRVVPPADVGALTQAVRDMACWIEGSSPDRRILTPVDREQLSWSAYARRYEAFLGSVVPGEGCAR